MIFLLEKLWICLNTNSELRSFIFSVVEEQVAKPSDNRWKICAGVVLVVVLVTIVIICTGSSSSPNPDSFDPGSWGTPISSPPSSPFFEELSEELLQELADNSEFYDDGAGVRPHWVRRFITPESSVESLPDLVDGVDLADGADLVNAASQIIS